MGMPLKREVPVTAAIASALVADEALQAPAQRLAAGVGHQFARLFPGEAHHQSRAVETDRVEIGQPALRVHVQPVALGHAGARAKVPTSIGDG